MERMDVDPALAIRKAGGRALAEARNTCLGCIFDRKCRRAIAAGGSILRIARPLNPAWYVRLPVVVNLFGTAECAAWARDREVEGLGQLGELLAWMRQQRQMLPAARGVLLSRPKIVIAPREWRGADPDYSPLAGRRRPLITWLVVVIRPPGETIRARTVWASVAAGYRMRPPYPTLAAEAWRGVPSPPQWRARGLEMPWRW